MKELKLKNEALSLANRIIFLLIAAWLTASASLNLYHQNTADYFTLSYAGLSGLLPLVALCILFFGIFYLIHKKNLITTEGRDLPGRLLFAAWLFFAATVLLRMKYTLPAATHLILTGTSLILARDIYRSAVKTLWPPDLVMAFAGLGLLIINLNFIPWDLFKNDFYMNLGIEPAAFLPLLFAFLGLVLALAALFFNKSKFFRWQYAVPFVMILALGLQIFLNSRILVARYESLSTPTFDFGLFVQMFHNMGQSLSPVTTLERNMSLSHFKVHISPIYYLMLPFFQLFKSPNTLQILQAIVVGLGIIPMLLTAKEFRLSIRTRVALSLVYLFSTAYISSNFYDLHENCFLPVMLFWLIYFIEKRNSAGIAVFTILTLLIKEDAALYIWALAVFVMFEYRMMKTGLVMLLGSGGYFLGAVKYLQTFGDGAMFGRFDSLIGIPELSLLAVPYSLFRNPGLVLTKIFGEDKFIYIIQMLGPLSFMPLFNRKLSRWVLLVPFLIMNLIVDYQYQFNMQFQYNYGTYTLLFYMALMFLRDISKPAAQKTEPTVSRKAFLTTLRSGAMIRNTLLVLAIALGMTASGFQIYYQEKYQNYINENQALLSSMKAAMDKIPPENSVLASTFISAYLAQRDSIYDIEYNVTDETYFPADYIVIDLRPGYKNDFDKYIPRFIADGYHFQTNITDQIAILKRNPQ